jgi:predicted nucleic acid-binding OB-fold protein
MTESTSDLLAALKTAVTEIVAMSHQLDVWAEENVRGGWSTNQVRPMRTEADRLRRVAAGLGYAGLSSVSQSDLLDALRKILEGARSQRPHTGMSWSEVKEIAETAIAKATGRLSR